jgi:catechol 2,3-dioxygenase-like lactoylglutathione lyase family enzyme
MALFKGLDTVVIRVRDLERARSWYERTLDLRASLIDEEERLAVLDLGGGPTLTLWEWGKGETPAAGPPVAFPVLLPQHEIETTRDMLAGRGVEVGPLQGEVGGLRFFSFSDPDGNRLEVCRW